MVEDSTIIVSKAVTTPYLSDEHMNLIKACVWIRRRKKRRLPGSMMRTYVHQDLQEELSRRIVLCEMYPERWSEANSRGLALCLQLETGVENMKKAS